MDKLLPYLYCWEIFYLAIMDKIFRSFCIKESQKNIAYLQTRNRYFHNFVRKFRQSAPARHVPVLAALPQRLLRSGLPVQVSAHLQRRGRGLLPRQRGRRPSHVTAADAAAHLVQESNPRLLYLQHWR
jgi:hypothetical protein